MAAVAGVRTLPYDWYADSAVLRLEQERIFARSWQYAARLDQVAEAGQLTTAWAGSLPVLLARGRDDELRGFVNVCRHRGHILCDGDARRETIQCPYHAWTYGLDGALQKRAPLGSRARVRHVRPRPRPGVGRHVGARSSSSTRIPTRRRSPTTSASCPTSSQADGIDVAALRFHARAESDEYACNWKICVENFLECYHCAVAHPSLSKVLDVSPDAYGLEARGRLASQFGPPRRKPPIPRTPTARSRAASSTSCSPAPW